MLFIAVMVRVMLIFQVLVVFRVQHTYHLTRQMLVVLVIRQQDVRQLTPICTHTICFTHFRHVAMVQHLVSDVVILN
jgi:hypothetical protein